MAARTVRIGVVAYRREDMDHIGAWGFHGERVDVHGDDVERFDSLNGEPAESPLAAAPVVEDGQPDGQPDADALDAPAVDSTVAPKGGASLAAWRDYAATLGATDADLDGKTRDQLREQFGPKE